MDKMTKSLMLTCMALSALMFPLVMGSNVERDESADIGYKIEGKVYPPDNRGQDWFWRTRVLIDGGKRIGYLKDDNTFAISGLPSGSYLVEVSNPDHFYEPIRVDITSKGKIRARKVNQVQPSQVTQVIRSLLFRNAKEHQQRVFFLMKL